MTKENSKSLSISVVVPVFNEEATIGSVLTKVNRVKNLKEIIVVDDGSSDTTSQIVTDLGLKKVRLIKLEKNKGKTHAVKKALQVVTGDITIIQDADLEYDPGEIVHVIEPIENNRADVVYGSRFLVRRAARVLYYYHFLANKFLTILSNILTNVNMTDIETCYKAFRTPLLKDFPLTSSGFGIEIELTALITKTQARIYEVPISYYGRTYEEGKKIKAIDGFAAVFYIFNYNLAAYFGASKRSYIKRANEYIKSVREGG